MTELKLKDYAIVATDELRVTDKRNFKCLIGMHQFQESGNPRVEGYALKFETHVLRCDFCGKLKVVKFKLN